jgi:isopenicillin N synthase-like dioxygenase
MSIALKSRPDAYEAYVPLVKQMIGTGYALVPVAPSILDEINGVYDLGRQFFARPSAEKHHFAAPAFVEGYREIGPEYSLVPERPDLTESFSMWYRNRHHPEFGAWDADCPLYPGILHCANTLSELTADLFRAMTAVWSPAAPKLKFQKASYIQLNYYEPAQHNRDLLQDPHEDGHLITLAKPNAPGLEVKLGDRFVAAEPKANEIVVMAGSLLSLMTGNLVPPLYHQVRNSHRTDPRYSLLFFVNPEINQTLDPWISNESNAGIDIIERAVNAPNQFGLPTLVDGEKGLGKLIVPPADFED